MIAVGIAAIILVSAAVQKSVQPVELDKMADAFVDSIGVVTHLEYLDVQYAEYQEIIRPRLIELR